MPIRKSTQLAFEGARLQTARRPRSRMASGWPTFSIAPGCHGGQCSQGDNLADKPPGWRHVCVEHHPADSRRIAMRELEQPAPRTAYLERRAQFWFMPVEIFQFLSDADLGRADRLSENVRSPPDSHRPPFKFNSVEHEGRRCRECIGNASPRSRKYRDNRPIDLGRNMPGAATSSRRPAPNATTNALQGWTEFHAQPRYRRQPIRSAELTTLLTTGQGKTEARISA